MDSSKAKKTFISAGLILLSMLIITGVLTFFVPHGQFDIATRTYHELPGRGISPLTWILSPILVLLSDSGTLVIAIIIFLLIIGGALKVLKESDLIEGVISKITKSFKHKRSVLLGVLTLFFMGLGAFVGIFEEVVPLVPIVIALCSNLGWDDLTGLGVSVLATGLGFAAAVFNPFTIGIAQELAGLPIFSGALLRILVFISVYLVLITFLLIHNKKHSVVINQEDLNLEDKVPRRAYTYFLSIMLLLVLTVIITPIVPILRDISLPLIALYFFIAAIGVGKICMKSYKTVFKTYLKGAIEMSPAIILILLASGVKHVMVEGYLLDRILYITSSNIERFSPFVAIIFFFGVVLILNFFIGSGSAKAFILIPIIMPAMEFLNLGKQLGILAFQFGDGFSNVLYPTNAVLLIALGLSGVSYTKWLKFIWPLQSVLFVLSIFWLWLAYSIGYGL